MYRFDPGPVWFVDLHQTVGTATCVRDRISTLSRGPCCCRKRHQPVSTTRASSLETSLIARPAWGPSASHRVFQRTPLHHNHAREACIPTRLRVSSTARVSELRSPSSWFLPTLTACLPVRSTGLLHPVSDHGVHRVAAAHHHLPVMTHGLSRRCHTLQSLLLPHSRTERHRWSIPSRRSSAANRPDLRAFLHVEVRCTDEPFPAQLHPLLSWAFSLEALCFAMRPKPHLASSSTLPAPYTLTTSSWAHMDEHHAWCSSDRPKAIIRSGS